MNEAVLANNQAFDIITQYAPAVKQHIDAIVAYHPHLETTHVLRLAFTRARLPNPIELTEWVIATGDVSR